MTREARRLIYVVMAFVTGVTLFRRRSVKVPEAVGEWRPVTE